MSPAGEHIPGRRYSRGEVIDPNDFPLSSIRDLLRNGELRPADRTSPPSAVRLAEIAHGKPYFEMTDDERRDWQARVAASRGPDERVIPRQYAKLADGRKALISSPEGGAETVERAERVEQGQDPDAGDDSGA